MSKKCSGCKIMLDSVKVVLTVVREIKNQDKGITNLVIMKHSKMQKIKAVIINKV
jgi:hypothetical protein